MRVFVAGSTGVIGRSLVPLLIENGHEVVALSRTPQKADALERLGATVAVADPLNRDDLTSAIKKAQPEVIINELTALAGIESGNFKKLDKDFALTNRFRTEVTDTLLAAGRLVGTRRFIAQSFCGWPFAREGGSVKTETDPFDPNPPASFSKTLAAIQYQEEALRNATDMETLGLRYGFIYGPGTGIANGSPVIKLVRKRMLPVVGDGGGIWSFIHISDVARATLAAVSQGDPGVYNVVDDEPARVSTWLPALAEAVGARPPFRVPVWLGKLAFGEGGVSMMTTIRGAANAKAKRDLGWQPLYATWRRGFVEGLG